MVRLAIFAAAFALLAGASPPARSWTVSDTWTYPVGTSCGLACEETVLEVENGGTLTAEVAVTLTCESTIVSISLDGADPVVSDPVPMGGTTGVIDLGVVAPGLHNLIVKGQVTGFLCDTVLWSGTLSVPKPGVTDDDDVLVPPGGDGTASTAVTGSPRPAGLTATLFHDSTTANVARLSVATYSGAPTGAADSLPTRAAAYLDLRLENGDPADRIVGEFLPPSPILPPNPVLPPNPIVPPNPILPPNPIRLAYWTGNSWAPVRGSGGSLPPYDSVANQFSVTFDSTSAPAVMALTGTVFAIIPNYYFRGFGIPLESGAMNVVKAGRAIPLKWQIFNEVVEPVADLQPAVVMISSVTIPCSGMGGATNEVDEYATGNSGLQNLGDGLYQLNWNTPKTYAGTCRRLQLDLGERNPDGTRFYRTADFQFTR